MQRKEMVAMLLAGGQGSRLGVLTNTKAKPGVSFGGMYRIIDFPLSNCVNSGVDTVGVLTQYLPLSLNRHIGIGIPWDLDRSNGGVTILAPYVKDGAEGSWYTGTANAIYQNLAYLDSYNPEYVLILSGDHIYKMDYDKMLTAHKEKNADVTIAVLEVPYEEASRFGIMNVNEDGSVYEFEEKPKNPKSNLASMGIYIFTWEVLRQMLIKDNRVHDDSDFGKHIIPALLNNGNKLYTYTFGEYWQDVGTIESYWQANMELIKTVPEFNLYEENWKIYTKHEHQVPHFISKDSDVKSAIISDGCEIYGDVEHSLLGTGVVIEPGAVVRNSIIMSHVHIGAGCVIDRAIIDENAFIGANVNIGEGENIPNESKPSIYNTGITVIGEYSAVPDGVSIGKNCVIYGTTGKGDYQENRLESGKSIINNNGGEHI